MGLPVAGLIRWEREMQNAVILINVEKGRIRGVAEQLADLEGISEVYSTCGRYDLIAIARTRDFESLATLVTERLMGVEGIRDTETLNAMQVHSRHDLDAMFSVGL
jgi:DNA-binding Lrp family transcriptional regulator